MAIPVSNKVLQPTTPQKSQKSGFQGSGFTNLSKILQANQQNRLGDTVNQGVNNLASNVSQNIDKSKQETQKQQTAAFKPYEGAGTFVQSAINDPNATANNESDFNRFRQIASGEYSGPQNLVNEQSVLGNVQNVQSLGNLGSSAGGREALLQTFIKNPNYSSGQRRLDTTLLGATGGDALRAIKATGANTGREYNTAQDLAQAQNQINQTGVNEASQNLDKQLTTERTTRDQELQDKLAQTQQFEIDQKAKMDSLKANLEQGQLTQDQAQMLGLNGVDGNTAYYEGSDPNSLVGYNYADSPYNTAEVASQDQATRINALNKLAGYDTNVFDPSKVGTYKASSVDSTGLNQGIATANENFRKASAEEQQLLQFLGQTQPVEGYLKGVPDEVIRSQYGNQLTQYNQALGGLQNFYNTNPNDVYGGNAETTSQGISNFNPNYNDTYSSTMGNVVNRLQTLYPQLARLTGKLNIIPNS